MNFKFKSPTLVNQVSVFKVWLLNSNSKVQVQLTKNLSLKFGLSDMPWHENQKRKWNWIRFASFLMPTECRILDFLTPTECQILDILTPSGCQILDFWRLLSAKFRCFWHPLSAKFWISDTRWVPNCGFLTPSGCQILDELTSDGCQLARTFTFLLLLSPWNDQKRIF